MDLPHDNPDEETTMARIAEILVDQAEQALSTEHR